MTNDNQPNDSYSNTDTQSNGAAKTQVEEFSINADTLMHKVQELLNESNIRRIIIKNPSGQVLLEIPLTAGLIGGAFGAVVFPPLVAIATIAVLAARLTLVVERRI
jgi:Domain of unknown function (DUF4342)